MLAVHLHPFALLPCPAQAYVKYNQSITHNKALREQINNLRRERLMFESIHSNLERELAKLKKDMADTIQLANQVGGAEWLVPYTHACCHGWP
jgi:hypothetical protein